MSEHTPGAVAAAQIIIRGRKRIHTEYGFKTVRGLAALIDRKTGAAELLEPCESLVCDIEAREQRTGIPQMGPSIKKARDAIASTKKNNPGRLAEASRTGY